MDKKSHSCETPDKGSTKSAQTGDPKEILKNLRLKNVNRLICAQLNINSLRNKFESLINIINNNIDILMISKTKLGTFMAFLNLLGLIELVTVVEYFCIFARIYLQN